MGVTLPWCQNQSSFVAVPGSLSWKEVQSGVDRYIPSLMTRVGRTCQCSGPAVFGLRRKHKCGYCVHVFRLQHQFFWDFGWKMSEG